MPVSSIRSRREAGSLGVSDTGLLPTIRAPALAFGGAFTIGGPRYPRSGVRGSDEPTSLGAPAAPPCHPLRHPPTFCARRPDDDRVKLWGPPSGQGQLDHALDRLAGEVVVECPNADAARRAGGPL